MSPLDSLAHSCIQRELVKGVRTEVPELYIKFSHTVIGSYTREGGLIQNLQSSVRKIDSIDQLKDESGEWRFAVAEGVFGAPKDAFRRTVVGRIRPVGSEGKTISELRFRIFDPTPKPPLLPPLPPKIFCLR